MRTDWASLPAVVRSCVETRTGRIRTAETIQEGLTCSVALSLRTADGDRIFVKGVDAADQDGSRAQLWETVVNPWVAEEVGPRLRWHATFHGWFFLAFDHVDGHHARLGPGAHDRDAVADLHRRMEKLPPPDAEVPMLRDRLSSFLSPRQAALLDGGHLLHTDTNPHNLMVSGDRAYLVDWAMPARGPVWVDVANTAVRLMEDGTPAEEARQWLDRFDAWREADPYAVRAFVDGTCARWEQMVGAKDARPSNARFRALVA